MSNIEFDAVSSLFGGPTVSNLLLEGTIALGEVNAEAAAPTTPPTTPPTTTPPARTNLVKIMSDQEDLFVNYEWEQTGAGWVNINPNFEWECRVFIEPIGEVDDTSIAVPPLATTTFTNGSKTYTKTVQLPRLPVGMYSVVASLQLKSTATGTPTNLATFKELGKIQVYKS